MNKYDIAKVAQVAFITGFSIFLVISIILPLILYWDLACYYYAELPLIFLSIVFAMGSTAPILYVCLCARRSIIYDEQTSLAHFTLACALIVLVFWILPIPCVLVIWGVRACIAMALNRYLEVEAVYAQIITGTSVIAVILVELAVITFVITIVYKCYYKIQNYYEEIPE